MIFTIRGDPFDFWGVRALRAGEGLVKNSFQSDFLGPYGIPHAYKCQAQHIFKDSNLSLRLIISTLLEPNQMELGFLITNEKASYVAKEDGICLLSVAREAALDKIQIKPCVPFIFNIYI